MRQYDNTKTGLHENKSARKLEKEKGGVIEN